MSEANDLIDHADKAFADKKMLPASEAQHLWLELCRTVETQIPLDLMQPFNVASKHSEQSTASQDLLDAKEILSIRILNRSKLQKPYDVADFIEDLINASLLPDQPLIYTRDAPTLSHAIWWLTSAGVRPSRIKDALIPFFPMLGLTHD